MLGAKIREKKGLSVNYDNLTKLLRMKKNVTVLFLKETCWRHLKMKIKEHKDQI